MFTVLSLGASAVETSTGLEVVDVKLAADAVLSFNPSALLGCKIKCLLSAVEFFVSQTQWRYAACL